MTKGNKKFKKIIKKRRKQKSRKNRARQERLNWKKTKPKPTIFDEANEIMREATETGPFPIVTDLDKLRKKSKRVEKIDKDFIKRLVATLILEPDAVGLSAIQVGRAEQYIAIKWQDSIMVVINPFITRDYWMKDYFKEGCLSVPGKEVLIASPRKITLNFTDQNGDKYENVEIKGFLARILRHEIDHINGTIIIDYEEK